MNSYNFHHHEFNSGFYRCRPCMYSCGINDPNRERHISSERHIRKLAKKLGLSLDDAIQISLVELNGHPRTDSFLYRNMFIVRRDQDLWFLHEDPGVDEPDVIPIEPDLYIPPYRPRQSRPPPISRLPPEVPDAVPTHFQTELAQAAATLGWECSICLESLTVDRFHLTPCFHKVCRTCVTKIVRCPVCRRDL